jgi:hypothetical protein
MVTVLSMWELVTYVSKCLMKMGQEQACEERTPHGVVSSMPIKVQAPGLTCTVTPHRDPSFFAHATFCQELSPDIEAEYRALAHQLPALEPPLRESYATEAEWRVAVGAHFQTWFRWRDAHPDDWRDAYQRACARLRELEEARRQPSKAFSVDVGRDGSVQRMPPKFLRTLRRGETWRFKPERRAPLQEALAHDTPIVRLQAQGKLEEAAALEASRQRIAARMASWPAEVQQQRQARWPWGRKALWIDPDQTPDDDVRFVLVLYLLQEQMGECTPETTRFLQRYMGQFRYAASREERELLQGEHTRFLLEGGGEGFAALLRTYTHPEHRKAHRRFIAKTLSGRWRTAAKQKAEQSGQSLMVVPSSDGLYSVHDVVRILAGETAGQWRLTRDWLDDRLKAGRLPFSLDARGWKCLDEHGLQYARTLIKDETLRRALVGYQTQKLGKSPRAANKYIQEHRARGESLEDIAKGLFTQGHGTLHRKPQRG